jgi:hypothetical protein
VEYTFTPYGDKSTAKRGFVRKFKLLKNDVETYLDKVDGKWGFFSDTDGPVNTKPVVAFKPKFPETPTSVKKTKEEPKPAIKKEEVVENEPAPVHDAFSAFAFSQLTAPKIIDTSLPAQTIVVSKIEKNRPELNGVKRPSAGTICAHVWEIATGLSNIGNVSVKPSLSQVVKASLAVGINQYTARTQYARWRVFHGITGRALD